MAISGAGDRPPLAVAVEDVRQRAIRYAADDHSDEARLARRDAARVEAWEARRRGRFVRLWAALLEVRVAVSDTDHARCQLPGRLCRSGHPVAGASMPSEAGQPRAGAGDEPDPVADHPRGALPHRYDPTPGGPFEQAYAAAYIQALMADWARVPTPDQGPRDSAPGPHGGVPPDIRFRDRVIRRHVLFLAGPGEASGWAAELAAAIVDCAGSPLAEVVGLEPDDGHAGVGGRWVHPACTLGPSSVDVLWDDYDAAGTDVGGPAALARVLGLVADQRHLRPWRSSVPRDTVT